MESKLFSIYGARKSKDGTRLNISLVTGEGDNKQFACVSIKLDSKKLKVAKDESYALVKIAMLKPTEKKEEKPTNDDMPF